MKVAFFAVCSLCVLLVLPACQTTLPHDEVEPVDPSVQAHLDFQERPDYRTSVYQNDALLESMTPEDVSIEVLLSQRRAYLKVGEFVAVDTPVSPGTASHPTPSGDFTIIGKKRMHHSNLYGRVLDAEGNVVQGSADSRKAEIPEGGRFQGTAMPYWMRLTHTGIGFHVGEVPDRPASHGCIRLPKAIAPVIFEKSKVGTPVVIKP